MKLCRIYCLSLMAGLWSAPALADWTKIRIHQIDPEGIGAEMGMVEAVDSWFTSLATLVFDISGLAPGQYKVWLHEVPDCGAAEFDGVVLAGYAAGAVYNRDDNQDGLVRGQLGVIEVTPEGDVTRTISVRPPKVVDGVDKVTVTEMRGRALVIHRAGPGPDTRVACGIIASAKEEPR